MRRARRAAMLGVLPQGAPGQTATKIKDRVKPLLPGDLFPGDLFPGGAASGWGLNCI